MFWVFFSVDEIDSALKYLQSKNKDKVQNPTNTGDVIIIIIIT